MFSDHSPFTIHRSPFSQFRCCDPLDHKCLDLVIHLEIVIIDKADTALEALFYLIRVVLESL